jgi:hypothetical protein
MQFTIQIVRDALGAELAQQQLSHANLATTEAHYFQRRTPGPDVRDVLDNTQYSASPHSASSRGGSSSFGARLTPSSRECQGSAEVTVKHQPKLNRPGMSGDSTSWEGWSHVRWFVEEVSAGAA